MKKKSNPEVGKFLWAYYVNLNQAFAERIAERCKGDDSVWVQDYHLMQVIILYPDRIVSLATFCNAFRKSLVEIHIVGPGAPKETSRPPDWIFSSCRFPVLRSFQVLGPG
jgi:hypothetical protein